MCVGGTGTNPLGTGEAGSPRPADTGMPVGRELSAWERALATAPCPGTFFRNEQLPVTALQELLSEQVSLNSGFLLQVQVTDTQSLQHLSWCLRTEQPALGALGGVGVSPSF